MHLDNLANELLLRQSFAMLHQQTGSTKTAIHKNFPICSKYTQKTTPEKGS